MTQKQKKQIQSTNILTPASLLSCQAAGLSVDVREQSDNGLMLLSGPITNRLLIVAYVFISN